MTTTTPKTTTTMMTTATTTTTRAKHFNSVFGSTPTIVHMAHCAAEVAEKTF